MKWKKWIAPLLLCGLLLPLTACQEEEKDLGDEVEDVIDEVGDKVEDAGDEIEDAVDEAADEVDGESSS